MPLIIFNKLKEKIRPVLEWKKDYIKTDIIYLTNGGFWLFMGQVTSFLFSFLLSIAFANLISKEIFGNYRYILALGATLSAFTLTGMNTAVSQAVARGFDGIYQKSVKVQIKWGSITFIAAVILALWYFYQGNYNLAIGVLIAGCSLPLTNSFNTFTAFLTGKKSFARLSIYNTYISFFSTLTTFIALIISHNLIIMLLGYFLSNIALNYYFHTRIKTESNDNVDNETISYGKHLSFSNWFPVLIQQIELILIFHYLGESSLAYYYFI
ncbi:MAG: oligosaccharide flippase family protein, partial [Candidatus Paceibacterota bacterium]